MRTLSLKTSDKFAHVFDKNADRTVRSVFSVLCKNFVRSYSSLLGDDVTARLEDIVIFFF